MQTIATMNHGVFFVTDEVTRKKFEQGKYKALSMRYETLLVTLAMRHPDAWHDWEHLPKYIVNDFAARMRTDYLPTKTEIADVKKYLRFMAKLVLHFEYSGKYPDGPYFSFTERHEDRAIKIEFHPYVTRYIEETAFNMA